MKKNITLLMLILFYHSIAQTPVIKSLGQDPLETNSGYYYKDLNQVLSQFEGTWKYTTGNVELIVKLKVLEEKYLFISDINFNYYTDILVGEYQYKVCNQIIVSTLDTFDDDEPFDFVQHLFGKIILKESVLCPECGPNEKLVILNYLDPYITMPGAESEIRIIRRDVGNTQRILFNFKQTSSVMEVLGQAPPPTAYSVPFGEYMLIKQP